MADPSLIERVARILARSDGVPDDASTGDYLRNARDLFAAMPGLSTLEDQARLIGECREVVERYANVHGVLTEDDRAFLDALLTKLNASVDGATK